MRCENEHRIKVSRLPPLPGDSGIQYLVALEYRKPKSLFNFPLFWSRSVFRRYVKIPASEVEPILWEERPTGWSVKLLNGTISGLASKDNFVLLKNTFYSDIETTKT